MPGPWTEEHRAVYAATIAARKAGLPPPEKARVARRIPVAPVSATPEPAAAPEAPPEPLDPTAPLPELVARMVDAVEGMRGTVLRVEDRIALIAIERGITPAVPPEPVWLPQLVEALRGMNRRLTTLERREVTSGDWEEAIEELLGLARAINGKIGKMEPRQRRIRNPGAQLALGDRS